MERPIRRWKDPIASLQCFPRDVIDKPHCTLDLNDFKVLLHFGCETLNFSPIGYLKDTQHITRTRQKCT